MATINPKLAAARPRIGVPPLKTATMDNPNTEKANSSGEPRYNITGRRMGILTASSMAPNTPPMSEAVYAAPKARPAWPCFAKGWPSRMVAADPVVPGTPNKTAGIVSEVVVTDPDFVVEARRV